MATTSGKIVVGEGIRWIHDHLRRWAGVIDNVGRVTPELMADILTISQDQIHSCMIKQNVPFLLKEHTVADITNQLGTQVETNKRRFLIETDLGIDDLAKMYRIWRVDPAKAAASTVIDFADDSRLANVCQEFGSEAKEYWLASGQFTDSPNGTIWEASIDILNWGKGVQGDLKIIYWPNCTAITVDELFATDQSGNFSARPRLPKKAWQWMMELAKLHLLDVIGDQSKLENQWRRFSAENSILKQADQYFSSLQTSHIQSTEDHYFAEDF